MNQHSDRPETTLFMIESLDGKISTGDTDELDVDKDFKRIVGVKEGLSQYYQLEKQTDPFSLNSGKVMAKIGVNKRTEEPTKMGCSFIIIDNKPHLTERGVEYLAKWVKTLYLVTANKDHPVYKVKGKYPNIEILEYEKQIDLRDVLVRMKRDFGAERITFQSGGTLNSQWLRQGLIDHISVVIAPCLIGGKNTPSLVDGESLHSQKDLTHVKALKLIKCTVLNDSYVHLFYDVVQNTHLTV